MSWAVINLRLWPFQEVFFFLLYQRANIQNPVTFEFALPFYCITVSFRYLLRKIYQSRGQLGFCTTQNPTKESNDDWTIIVTISHKYWKKATDGGSAVKDYKYIYVEDLETTDIRSVSPIFFHAFKGVVWFRKNNFQMPWAF